MLQTNVCLNTNTICVVCFVLSSFVTAISSLRFIVCLLLSVELLLEKRDSNRIERDVGKYEKKLASFRYFRRSMLRVYGP
jgi:hypothetical protein